MDYLEKLGFDAEQIEQINNINHPLILDKISKNSHLLKKNITFLKDLGITNYKELFIEFSEIFLQDASVFKDKFLMYDRQDLIDKLLKNKAIITRL